MIRDTSPRCTCPPNWVASDHHPEKCRLYDTSVAAPSAAPRPTVSSGARPAADADAQRPDGFDAFTVQGFVDMVEESLREEGGSAAANVNNLLGGLIRYARHLEQQSAPRPATDAVQEQGEDTKRIDAIDEGSLMLWPSLDREAKKFGWRVKTAGDLKGAGFFAETIRAAIDLARAASRPSQEPQT